jgi:hypothetical protein
MNDKFENENHERTLEELNSLLLLFFYFVSMDNSFCFSFGY